MHSTTVVNQTGKTKHICLHAISQVGRFPKVNLSELESVLTDSFLAYPMNTVKATKFIIKIDR